MTRQEKINNVRECLAEYVAQLPAGITVERCRKLVQAKLGRGIRNRYPWWHLADAIVTTESHLAELLAGMRQ